MTEKETTSGGAVWRKRAIASVSVAAAVAAVGVGFASSASAVTPTPARTNPTVTVTAPATLANDGTGSGLFSVEVDNSASGNEAIPGTSAADNTVANTATLKVNFTVPSGLSCAQIVLTADSTVPATLPAGSTAEPAALLVTGTSPTCTASFGAAYTQPANSDITYNFDESVTAVGSTTPTGTISATATLAITDGSNGNVNNITSAASTTTLANPAAPTFSTVAVPAATIYQPYSFQLVTSFGTPSTSPGEFRAFGAPTTKNADGTYPDDITNRTVDDTYYNAATKNYDPSIDLSDNIEFDTVTGYLVSDDTHGNNGGIYTTDSAPEYAWTIIANNGEGGANDSSTTYPVAGIGTGTTHQPTPDTDQHDVDSAQFTIPVLFSDVAVTSAFGANIYDLADTGAIRGFADGTYRPGTAVTREQFVNILVGYDPNDVFAPVTGNGECSTLSPSSFSDVPNSSIFCQAIKELSDENVIKGSGGKFRPGAVIIRQEMAAILYRFYAVEETGNVLNGDAPFTSPSPFTDVTSSNPFAGDIEWAAKNHIANGYADGTFKPKNSTTRDQTAAFIDRTHV